MKWLLMTDMKLSFFSTGTWISIYFLNNALNPVSSHCKIRGKAVMNAVKKISR